MVHRAAVAIKAPRRTMRRPRSPPGRSSRTPSLRPSTPPAMRAYVITTGAVFGLLTMAHVLRMVMEKPDLASDPFYLAITAASAALGIWAWIVLRRAKEGRR